jgi:hypothetical protein
VVDTAISSIPVVSPSTVRHLAHDELAGALPTVAQFGWLPPDVSVNDDSDLTSGLSTSDCAGHGTVLPSREESATNRNYVSGEDRLAEVTVYDVETVAGAQEFIAAFDTVVHCPDPPPAPVSYEIVEVATPTRCDDVRAVRTHQPVSETIDAWCRVGNLIAWVRLSPSGMMAAMTNTAAPPPVAPTDQQATQTLVVVGEHLHTVWDTAGCADCGPSSTGPPTTGDPTTGPPTTGDPTTAAQPTPTIAETTGGAAALSAHDRSQIFAVASLSRLQDQGSAFDTVAVIEVVGHPTRDGFISYTAGTELTEDERNAISQTLRPRTVRFVPDPAFDKLVFAVGYAVLGIADPVIVNGQLTITTTLWCGNVCGTGGAHAVGQLDTGTWAIIGPIGPQWMA